MEYTNTVFEVEDIYKNIDNIQLSLQKGFLYFDYVTYVKENENEDAESIERRINFNIFSNNICLPVYELYKSEEELNKTIEYAKENVSEEDKLIFKSKRVYVDETNFFIVQKGTIFEVYNFMTLYDNNTDEITYTYTKKKNNIYYYYPESNTYFVYDPVTEILSIDPNKGKNTDHFFEKNILYPLERNECNIYEICARVLKNI